MKDPLSLEQHYVLGTVCLMTWLMGVALGYTHRHWLKKHLKPLLFPPDNTNSKRLLSINFLALFYIVYAPLVCFLLGLVFGYLLDGCIRNTKQIIHNLNQ
jgi:uncharacterized membrane protein